MRTKKQKAPKLVTKDKALEFIRAAAKGDSRRVRAFLKNGMDVNAVYQYKTKASVNALVGAVRNNHTEVVRLLLEHGAKPSLRAATVERWGTQFEVDALGLAAEMGSLEIVRLLLNAGADVNESINYDLDALTAAVSNRHIKIVRELLQAGYRVEGPGGVKALDEALSRNSERIAIILIRAGADVRQDQNGQLLLLAAADKGMVSVVKAMLEVGADPKAKLITGKSTLQSLKFYGRHKINSNKDEKKAAEILQLLEQAVGRK